MDSYWSDARCLLLVRSGSCSEAGVFRAPVFEELDTDDTSIVSDLADISFCCMVSRGGGGLAGYLCCADRTGVNTLTYALIAPAQARQATPVRAPMSDRNG